MSLGVGMWIWQQESWPDFYWDQCTLAPILRKARLAQGVLLGKMSTQTDTQQQTFLDNLLANIVYSSAIEGEKLNALSVRSSLAKRLGVEEETPFPTTPQTEGFAEVMLDAVQNFEIPLSLDRILAWHEKLFPEGQSIIQQEIKGGYLRGDEPMQVVSGRIDRPTVHFIAPDREGLDKELEHFINWFNESKQDELIDPMIRAAIAHLWFVTLHPLEDGNGRVTRLLTDLALAQAEQQSVRFYAMSVTILEKRNSYYEILERTQKGDLDITNWLVWFLDTLLCTFESVIDSIEQIVFKTNYWRRVDQTKLTTEQAKVLNRMLDGDFELGINASQYQKVAKVSRPTATRHLTVLVEWGCLEKSEAGGRSTRYFLKKNFNVL